MLDFVAEVLDGVPDLPSPASEPFLNVSLGLVGAPLIAETVIVGEVPDALLQVALDLILLAVELLSVQGVLLWQLAFK